MRPASVTPLRIMSKAISAVPRQTAHETAILSSKHWRFERCWPVFSQPHQQYNWLRVAGICVATQYAWRVSGSGNCSGASTRDASLRPLGMMRNPLGRNMPTRQVEDAFVMEAGAVAWALGRLDQTTSKKIDEAPAASAVGTSQSRMRRRFWSIRPVTVRRGRSGGVRPARWCVISNPCEESWPHWRQGGVKRRFPQASRPDSYHWRRTSASGCLECVNCDGAQAFACVLAQDTARSTFSSCVQIPRDRPAWKSAGVSLPEEGVGVAPVRTG